MITVEKAISAFLLAGRADGYTKATERWYKHLLGHIAARFYGREINTITADDLRQHIVSLRQRETRYAKSTVRPQIQGGLSNESLRCHIRALKTFFAWCADEYGIDNPSRRIKVPASQQQPPKAIELSDLKKMIEATNGTNTGIRDRAILLFLADTGCRAAGLLTLTIEGLDLDRHLATVCEKGNKTRIVPFTGKTANAIRRWLEIRPRGASTLFCSQRRRDQGHPLTLSGLHLLLSRLKKRSGVTGRVNAHSFRHFMAIQYLKNGGDHGALSMIMGHSDVKVTMRVYARLSPDDLATLHDKYSPVGGL